MRLTPWCQTKFYVRAPLELQSLSPRTDFRCCIRPIYLLFTPGSYRHRGIQMLFILGLKRTLILKSIYWTVFLRFHIPDYVRQNLNIVNDEPKPFLSTTVTTNVHHINSVTARPVSASSSLFNHFQSPSVGLLWPPPDFLASWNRSAPP